MDNKEFNAPDYVVLMYCTINNVQNDILIIFDSKEQRDKFTFKPGQILCMLCQVEIWPEDGMTIVDENFNS